MLRVKFKFDVDYFRSCHSCVYFKKTLTPNDKAELSYYLETKCKLLEKGFNKMDSMNCNYWKESIRF